MRDVDLRPGPFPELAKTGSEIGVRMTVEDGNDLEPFALGLGEVIIDIAFRIDHCGLAVGAKKIGSMSESFDKETFEIQKRGLELRFVR